MSWVRRTLTLNDYWNMNINLLVPRYALAASLGGIDVLNFVFSEYFNTT